MLLLLYMGDIIKANLLFKLFYRGGYGSRTHLKVKKGNRTFIVKYQAVEYLGNTRHSAFKYGKSDEVG